MPDPVVIRCPDCHHLVAVPEDFLGKVVTCLECRAAFTAPARDGDALTAPKLIRPGRRKVPAFVFVPMLGLLLLGTAGVMVNGYLYFTFRNDPEAAKDFAAWGYRQMSKERPDDEPKAKGPLPEEEARRREERAKEFQAGQERRVEESAAAAAPFVGPVQGPFALVSLGVLAGGVAFAARRGYWLAFAGCLLAVVNVNHMCCVPGAVAGVWGFFALISEEGRRHFGRV
jgi:hypothetical protein